MKPFHEIDLTDFSDVSFRTAFQMYFKEFGIRVQDWDGLFREMLLWSVVFMSRSCRY